MTIKVHTYVQGIMKTHIKIHLGIGENKLY